MFNLSLSLFLSIAIPELFIPRNIKLALLIILSLLDVLFLKVLELIMRKVTSDTVIFGILDFVLFIVFNCLYLLGPAFLLDVGFLEGFVLVDIEGLNILTLLFFLMLILNLQGIKIFLL